MSAVNKLGEKAYANSGYILDVWIPGPGRLAVTAHHSHRDFEDGFDVGTGQGLTLEEAIADLLSSMAARTHKPAVTVGPNLVPDSKGGGR